MTALLLLLLMAGVFAPEPLEDGAVTLPGGRALLVEVEPADAPLVLLDASGAALPWWGVPEGALLPAADLTRRVEVLAPADAELRVLVEGSGGESHAWDLWEQRGLEAIARGEPLPSPPWGGERLRAEASLRTEAVADPSVAALGLLLDAASLRPITARTHRAERQVRDPRLPPEGPGLASMELEGPAVVILRTWPRGEANYSRYRVGLRVDGQVQPTPLQGATGGAARAHRVPVGPGLHSVEVFAPVDAPLTWTLETRALRPTLRGPRLPESCAADPERSPAAAAELAWLCGDREAARQGFEALRSSASPAERQLALARLIELTEDESALIELVDEALSAPPGPGRELAAAASFARLDALPQDRVRAALEAAEDPDLVALARWLDAHSDARPLGDAVLQAARPAFGPDLERDERLQRSLSTRWSRLEPLTETDAQQVIGGRGPGTPRIRVRAGESAQVQLPPHYPARTPVLRLQADGPVAIEVDGQALRSPGGRLDLAVTPGLHGLSVQEGSLLLLDAEGASGGERVYSYDAVALPASWRLPDPGVPVELRVDHHGVDPNADCPLLADFDDGWTVCVRGEQLIAPATARAVTLRGAGHLSLSARAPLRAARPAPIPPSQTPEADLARLPELTARIDAGEAAARLERAELLAGLGLLSAARRDLIVLLRGEDQALALRAQDMGERLPPERPSAPSELLAGGRTLAPRTPEAAVALDGRGADPGDPDALLRLAEDSPVAPWLRVEAARLLEAQDPARALAAAQDAGPPGEPVVRRITSRAELQPVGRPETGSGLVTIQVPPRPFDPEAPLWARARDAMLGLPWPPEDGLLARDELGALVRFRGQSARLELFCRDEDGPGRPCTLTLRLDGERTTLTVPEGGEGVVHELGPLSPGMHELELSAPGRGAALGLRVSVGGEPLPAISERSAWKVTPKRPTRFVVMGPALVRVDLESGEVAARWGERSAQRLDDALWLAITEEGPAEIELSGDAQVFPWWGWTPPPVAPSPLPLGPEPPRSAADGVAELALARLSERGAPPLPPIMGPPGSLRLAFTPIYERLGYSEEWWSTAELSIEGLIRRQGQWALAQAWGRGPDLVQPLPLRGAAGARLEVGTTIPQGWLGLRAELGRAWRSGYAAGGANLLAFGARDLRLGPDLELRGAGWARVGRYTDTDTGLRLDPRAWNSLKAEWPAQLAAQASLIGTPARELRWELGVELSPAWSPTQGLRTTAGAFAELDLLLGESTLFGLDARVNSRFDDGVIEANEWGPRLIASVDRAVWTRDTRRWSTWAKVELSPVVLGAGAPTWVPVSEALEGRVGVTLLLSPRRGLADVPPYQELFRAARGWP